MDYLELKAVLLPLGQSYSGDIVDALEMAVDGEHEEVETREAVATGAGDYSAASRLEHRPAVFLDPPYTGGGGKRVGVRLYAHGAVDHEALFKAMAARRCHFMMTYDHAPEIIELVRRYAFHAVLVEMKNTHHNRQFELVITRERIFS